MSETTRLNVTGMTCGHCVAAVTNALESLPGVTAVEVKLDTGEARVWGDADLATLIAAIQEEGYEAAPAD